MEERGQVATFAVVLCLFDLLVHQGIVARPIDGAKNTNRFRKFRNKYCIPWDRGF